LALSCHPFAAIQNRVKVDTVFLSVTRAYGPYLSSAVPTSKAMKNLILLFASIFCHTVLLAAWHNPYWFALSCLCLSGMLVVAFWPRTVDP
jgi:hypothetical protein